MDAKVLLCDHAQVSGGKLFVSGGGVSLVGSARAEPPLPVSISLAIVVGVPWVETGREHQLTVELVSDSGTGAVRVPLADSLPAGFDASDVGLLVLTFAVGRSDQLIDGDETQLPIAIPLQGLHLPRLGPYFFTVGIDGREMDRASFRAVPLREITAT